MIQVKIIITALAHSKCSMLASWYSSNSSNNSNGNDTYTWWQQRRGTVSPLSARLLVVSYSNEDNAGHLLRSDLWLMDSLICLLLRTCWPLSLQC